MRTDIINFLKEQELGSFQVSERLPWDEAGQALYFNNKKHIYVDVDQVSQSAEIDTLDNLGVVKETVVVMAWVVMDAKRLPADYTQSVDAVKSATQCGQGQGYVQRTVQVTSSYSADDLVTKFEFSFSKIIT
jgi:hypothetical protein